MENWIHSVGIILGLLINNVPLYINRLWVANVDRNCNNPLRMGTVGKTR